MTCHGHFFSIALVSSAIALSFVFHEANAQQTALTECPTSWIKNKDSCYFTGERFNGQSWSSAAAFCHSLGAALVEVNDIDEYNFIKQTAKQVTWTDGPWLGMLRLWGDERWVLPSLRTTSGTSELDKLVGDTARGSTHDCGGFDKFGNQFGFWRCLDNGSPLCEIDLKS